MLLAEMNAAGAELRLNAKVQYVEKTPDGFTLQLATGEIVECGALVVATRRQVHSQDGRHRFRLSAGRAVRHPA